jgi:Zn-finger nucleic acid-binding protein
VGKQGSTEVCFCPKCRGFVIDSESLGALIQSRRATYRGADDIPSLVDVNELDVHGRCPACEQVMEAHHYFGPGNIILDTCSTCKLAWLDHGEFAKIIRAPGVR